MMPWHKQASGSAAVAPLAPAHGVENGVERSAFAWEDWFRHAGPQQRARALGIAQKQGFIYSHQLPPVSNGNGKASNTYLAPESAAATLLSRILAGKLETMAPLENLPLAFCDADLDDVQQQAVQRALATPDLFALQGLPGTGKSRVLAEIFRQTAKRGWRVLFLGGHTASLDVVLERLVGTQDVLALRFLEQTEKPETLPAWLRGFTLEEQKRAFCERVQAGARGNREQVEAACRRHGEQDPLWAELQACAGRWRALQERRHNLLDQLDNVAAAVERDAASPGAATGSVLAQLADLRHVHDQAAGVLDKTLQTQREALAQCDQEMAGLAARIAALEPGYAAKKDGRFWTLAFWVNLLSSAIVQEMESARQQHADAQKRQEKLAAEIADLEQRRAHGRDQFHQQRAALLATEIAARQGALRSELQTLDADQHRLDDEWAARCAGLDAGSIDKTPEAIAAAHQAWERKKVLGEEECQFAHQWVKFIEESAPQWATRLASFASLLAGTIGRWNGDARFRDAGGGAPFDLVVIEDADALTEADLLKLSRHALRCVLVGAAIVAAPPPLAAEKSARPVVAKPVTSSCWQRLWQALGGDDGCWPHAWQREQGRLVCQLMPLGADDRQHFEYEGLADAPDIELGILHRPSTRPCLAQVTFGANCAFADAFAFMIREVQEFPLQPLGRTGWWREDDRRVYRHLGPAVGRMHAWLDIDAGLRLGATLDEYGDATRIATIEFDKSAGWDRGKADAWLARHRPIRDHERTVQLQVPYRFLPPLAKIIVGVVRSGEWLPAPLALDAAGLPALEFIAVPAGERCEGAGLELDLSAPRSADKLPTGLRHGLPTRGFVNYLEAQALIRRLEAWSQKEATDNCRAAVLALYEGQAVLLRRLVEQSEILRARRHPLEVALPSRWHQRECDVVFLSLTRSHANRAAAYGDDVRELPIALTRARKRVLIFGDAGALCKRLACPGPLDHHDPHAAQQEHGHLARLLTCVQPHIQTPAIVNGVAHGKG